MMRLALALLVCALSAGCAHVAPYERSTLMSRLMMENPSALESINDAHIVSTREQMRGASGAGGASCGCN
jgi:hypothetical protein